MFFRVCCLRSIAQFLKTKIKTCFYVRAHFDIPVTLFKIKFIICRRSRYFLMTSVGFLIKHFLVITIFKILVRLFPDQTKLFSRPRDNFYFSQPLSIKNQDQVDFYKRSKPRSKPRSYFLVTLFNFFHLNLLNFYCHPFNFSSRYFYRRSRKPKNLNPSFLLKLAVTLLIKINITTPSKLSNPSIKLNIYIHKKGNRVKRVWEYIYFNFCYRVCYRVKSKVLGVGSG